jgi:drug/metabolite transporter (DMT)-like permease
VRNEKEASTWLWPYLALGLLALIWGASFLFIKVAVKDGDMSPTTLVLIRVVSAAVTLGLIFAVTNRNPFPPGTRRRLPAFAVMAVFSSAFPWLAFGIGELYISSALASILNATTPLWTAVFAYWVTPAERPSPVNYLGVAVGFAGTAIIVAPQLLTNSLHAGALGTLIIMAAAVSYAASALFQRRRLAGVSPLLASLWQMAIGTLVMLPLATPTLRATRFHFASMASALVLGVGGSAIAYVLYYYILNTLGATRATTVVFLLPATAVLWGATILHEEITLPILAGMAVILLGVFFTSRRGAPKAIVLSEKPVP